MIPKLKYHKEDDMTPFIILLAKTLSGDFASNQYMIGMVHITKRVWLTGLKSQNKE